MKRPSYRREEQPQLGLGIVSEPEANAGVGDENDFYPTPARTTRLILPHLPPATRWLDPCAGTGALLDVVREERRATIVQGIEIDPARALVCQEKGLDVEVNDALAIPTWPAMHVILENPPFNLAMEFLERSLFEAKKHDAIVCVLLRLAFLEGQARADFHRANPADVYVLAERPQFIDPKAWRPCPKCKGAKTIAYGAPRVDVNPGGSTSLIGSVVEKCSTCSGRGEIKGGTSSAAHAWFVWESGRGGRWFVLGGGA